MRTLPAKFYATFETASGICAIAWNEAGICGFQLGTSKPEDIENWRRRLVPDADIAQVIDAAIRYFGGQAVDFTRVELDLAGQPEFFLRVYAALRQIPYGKTTTYGELARMAGAGVERSREVGVAMATNPVPLIIPCHRVLAANGGLGGFSAPGGTESKTWMLGLEGVADPQGRLF